MTESRGGACGSRASWPGVEAAQALVREQLADGPRRGEEVQAAAHRADIPERALIAAADALGVRTQGSRWIQVEDQVEGV